MVARILIGNLPGGTQGVRVSDAGYDVMSNPVDNERMTFNSDWPGTFGFHVAGNGTITRGQTLTINYATLGYMPMVFFALKSNVQPTDGLGLPVEDLVRWQSLNYRNAAGFSGAYTVLNASTLQLFPQHRVEVYTNRIIIGYTGPTTTSRQSLYPASLNYAYCVTTRRMI